MASGDRTAPAKVLMIWFVIFMVPMVLQVVLCFTLISGISGKNGPGNGRFFGGGPTAEYAEYAEADVKILFAYLACFAVDPSLPCHHEC